MKIVFTMKRFSVRNVFIMSDDDQCGTTEPVLRPETRESFPSVSTVSWRGQGAPGRRRTLI